MNFKELKYCLGRHWHNIPGWRTKRKIVVFESDDWGSIRMPSKEIYNIMLKKGYPVNCRPFEKFDSLESREDLQALYEVITEIKDKSGKNVIITTNFIMTNPDFERIRQSDFRQFYGENFIETYKKYYGSDEVFKLIQEGILARLIYPQYHGYSHFNYPEWMEALENGAKDEIFCFDHEMVGVPSPEYPEKGNQLMDALHCKNIKHYNEQKEKLIEGVKIFKEIFRYNPVSFIAPVYTWPSDIEYGLSLVGIRYLQGGRFQKEVYSPDGKIRKRKHTLGDRNSFGQYYLVRNVFFEPSIDRNKDWINSSLKAIKAAFFWKKPAIISTHRLNYIGKIHPYNRKKNLELLKGLLNKIILKWPDVEFLTSDQLGLLIEKDYENRNS